MVVSYSRVKCVCVVYQSNNVQNTIRQQHEYIITIGYVIPGAKLSSRATTIQISMLIRVGVLKIKVQLF